MDKSNSKINLIAQYVKCGAICYHKSKDIYYYYVSTDVRRNNQMLVRKSQLNKAVQLGLITKEDISNITTVG